MTSTADRLRQPKGIPVGGQFAPDPNSNEAAPIELESTASQVPSAFTTRYATPQERTEALTAEIEKAVEGMDSDANWLAWLDTMSKFHNYSINNQILIKLQNPTSSRVAGFRKWQELGRQVRKGEKGISIITPVTVKRELKDANGNPVLDAKGKPKSSRVPIKGRYSVATVFDISQTDGDPLPSCKDGEDMGEIPEGFKEELIGVIEDHGYRVEFQNLGGWDLQGYTSGTLKAVVIDSRLPEDQALDTLAHELGHIAAGHMERHGEYSTRRGCRGEMEVEAQSFAYSVLRMAGMNSSKSTGGYVKGWAGVTGDSEVIRKSMTNISKAIHNLVTSGKISAFNGR